MDILINALAQSYFVSIYKSIIVDSYGSVRVESEKY